MSRSQTNKVCRTERPRNYCVALVMIGVSLFLAVSSVEAQGPAVLTSNDVTEVRAFLASKRLPSQWSVEASLAKVADPSFRQKVIAYYQDPKRLCTPDERLMVGTCYAHENQYSNAIRLTREYLEVFPHDSDAMGTMGNYMMQCGAFGRAIPILTNALYNLDNYLGETNDSADEARENMKFWLECLLMKASILAGREDIARTLLPGLTESHATESVDEAACAQGMMYAVLCAVAERDNTNFTKAVALLGLHQLSESEEFWGAARLGCSVFGTNIPADIPQAVQEVVDKDVTSPKRYPPTMMGQADAECINGLLRAQKPGKADLNTNEDEDLGRKLIYYFLAETNPVPEDAKYAIARSFAQAGDYGEAVKLGKQYVQAHPKEWRGWRLVSLACYADGAYMRAFEEFTNGVAVSAPSASDLAEPQVLFARANAAFMTGQHQTLRGLLPKVMEYTNQKNLPDAELSMCMKFLGQSAICLNDNELFLKSFAHVTVRQLQNDASLSITLLMGRNLFHADSLDQLWEDYKTAASEQEPSFD